MTAPGLVAVEPPRLDAVALMDSFGQDRRFHLAFPGATDLTYPDLAKILTGQLLNNVGDAFVAGHGRNHTKDVEVGVIRQLGALFGADSEKVWGYVAPCGTEGNIHAIDEAATAYPDVLVYASTAAHYSVPKAARLVRTSLVQIRTDPHGRMRLDDLREKLRRHRNRAAVIVATIGTTEREAYDQVDRIAEVCAELGLTRYRIHVDAAMAGSHLALLPAHQRPPFDFRAGATSIVVSGHKFWSTLMPCAVVMYPSKPGEQPSTTVSYIGSTDTTIAGSRSGHTPLLLRWSLDHGLDFHRRRAEKSRAMAAYTLDRLRTLGWKAARGRPEAITITLAQPGPLRQPWVLAGNARTGRIVCMPGLQQAWIDDFLSDLLAACRGRIIVPTPRRTAPARPIAPQPDIQGQEAC